MTATPTLLENLLKQTTSVSATEGVRGAGFVPSGVVLPFAGTTAPAGWLFCYGQSLANASYPDLYAAIGTTYGSVDGSHFNLPDMRGRVGAGKDDMGGTGAGRLAVTLTGTKASTSSGVITGLSSTAGLAAGMQAFGTGIGTSAVINSIDSGTQVTLSVNSTSTGSTSIRFAFVDGVTLGASGGSHIQTLSATQIPSHNHPVFLNDPGHSHSTSAVYFTGSNNISGGSTANLNIQALASSTVTTGITVRDATGGGGTANQTALSTGGGGAHSNTQPTLVLNQIIKT